ncbi:glycerophosphodiester phosphodiesterase family protein, partial [Sphingopyxis sp.]|uniref:glycerophosphodiester phosphodiesterase family protein n=1 Tax=Sphingopyxis sp. TaxID=1908224 RepID=UPI002ED7EE28
KLDCGSGVRPQYAGARHIAVPGARIPELGEVLRAFKDSEALFFAETKIPKDADIDPVKFATLLDAAVRENGLEDRLILQSFDFRTIDALHRINPRIRTCLLGVPRQTRDYLAMLRRHHATCIVLGHDEIDRTETGRLQGAGILVFSGVADQEDQWRKYADLGVDAIFTNDPEGAVAFLKRSGLRD